MKFRFTDPRHIAIALLYAAIVSVSVIFACLLRFDFAIPSDQVRLLSQGLLLALPIKMVSFLVGRLHRPIWRFATAGDLLQLLVVNVLASLAFAAAFLLTRGSSVPSIYRFLDLFSFNRGRAVCPPDLQ
jgi:FlaA1/EpsC-like NDP-sugar epimerase